MKKETIILLPALMCDERLYSHQVQQLNPFFNIIIPVIKDINNITTAANYVFKLADENNVNTFYLAGTSMGGYIAMEMMKINPSRIKKLALINTTAAKENIKQAQNRLQIINETKQIKPENFIGINDKIISYYLHNINEENNTLIKDMVKTLGKDVLINQQELILSRTSTEEDLKNYNIPSLVIVGIYDNITPVEAHKKIANLLPNSQLIILDECKHLSPIDQKVAVSSLLQLWFYS